MKSITAAAAFACLAAIAVPASAQDEQTPAHTPAHTPAQATVYDGDYLSVGVGAGYGPTYDGSDDYTLFPAPIVQGSLGGVKINPRAAGLAVDFVPGPLNLGVAGRMRKNRASDIKDPVVESLGELDTAVEVGPTVGLSLPGVLHQYDSLTLSVDTRWDVAGAHKGMVVDPSITYFTPLSRGMAASLSLSAEHGDGKYLDYYYSVTPAQALASGLPAFDADGGGFTKAGGSLLLAFDLDGELANGGFGLVLLGAYSRMLGDAKDSPLTSVRGSADQWMGAVGLGYTF